MVQSGCIRQNEFHKNEVAAVRYFSAKVRDDPPKLQRQLTYWRALKTIPGLEIIEGNFRTRIKMAKVVQPPPDKIQVYRTEEKGSDVNLGAHLLMDGFKQLYDVAVVITGDSDLVTPIRMVKDELKMTVIVVNPQFLSLQYGRRERRPSLGLHEASSVYRDRITEPQLLRAQFPPTMADANGTFSKPLSW